MAPTPASTSARVARSVSARSTAKGASGWAASSVDQSGRLALVQTQLFEQLRVLDDQQACRFRAGVVVAVPHAEFGAAIPLT
ncbi:hypothetical protein [Streptomyces sp. DSM 40750]|uniref:hypothetical protein n=1 Tax=Streptomyces sp. DSM 40750 TaxID=2801030 RepID=UPI00214C4BB2|nr:hypothetical protein [Streptomyces sp. DSM 40750]UUU19631.1 hypothetical protein JIX55_04520 [Streptomyces sp. DSM 40750]UUU27027.1 hypothetical protein JIX55_46230 [Streptomyces sp. DSM 40750]